MKLSKEMSLVGPFVLSLLTNSFKESFFNERFWMHSFVCAFRFLFVLFSKL